MKQFTTDYHALDIRELSRGWLQPHTAYIWKWKAQNGSPEATISITVLQNMLQLQSVSEPDRTIQTVRLTQSVGPGGGKRSWFVCPTCQRRVGVLYRKDGIQFSCRMCAELAYPSQYKSKQQGHGRQKKMTRLASWNIMISKTPVGKR